MKRILKRTKDIIAVMLIKTVVRHIKTVVRHIKTVVCHIKTVVCHIKTVVCHIKVPPGVRVWRDWSVGRNFVK